MTRNWNIPLCILMMTLILMPNGTPVTRAHAQSRLLSATAWLRAPPAAAALFHERGFAYYTLACVPSQHVWDVNMRDLLGDADAVPSKLHRPSHHGYGQWATGWPLFSYHKEQLGCTAGGDAPPRLFCPIWPGSPRRSQVAAPAALSGAPQPPRPRPHISSQHWAPWCLRLGWSLALLCSLPVASSGPIAAFKQRCSGPPCMGLLHPSRGLAFLSGAPALVGRAGCLAGPWQPTDHPHSPAFLRDLFDWDAPPREHLVLFCAFFHALAAAPPPPGRTPSTHPDHLVAITCSRSVFPGQHHAHARMKMIVSSQSGHGTSPSRLMPDYQCFPDAQDTQHANANTLGNWPVALPLSCTLQIDTPSATHCLTMSNSLL